MKVLVTGSSGRIGRAIVARLMRNHDVIGYDRNPASTTHVIANVADELALGKAIQGVDAVVHTASLHAPHVSHVPDAVFNEINIAGTESIIRCCARYNVQNLVYTSTTALYGAAATPIERASWITEEIDPVPLTIYHTTKLKAEALLCAAANSGQLRVTVIRMSRCFPEPAPIMAMYRLHRGIDVRDVATAHELALTTNEPPFRVFVVSGTTPFQPADVFRLKANAAVVIQERAPAIAEAFARRGWMVPSGIDRVYSNAKIQRELGWAPRFGFDAVLHQYDEDSPEVLPPVNDWNARE